LGGSTLQRLLLRLDFLSGELNLRLHHVQLLLGLLSRLGFGASRCGSGGNSLRAEAA